MSRLPLFASGKLGADYELLFAYWEIAKEERSGKEADVILREEDLQLIEEKLREAGKVKLEDLVLSMLPEVSGRINNEIAKKAYKKRYNVDVPSEVAVNYIAKIIILWALEALEIEGKLNLDF
ncbi:MAG: hypothetical protein GU347_02765 [Desulfurococcales archaeon]|jgi:hypothetical protein|uniref:Uncharacterized protein n=1 Tax=Fervidicoccus fontis TaxID=683846 RepID=A0A7J3SKZ3_9CREN|nr:hypothetical protein [Thermoprotei archaeon]NAY89622.1 hypothetical protein [Desulfurococcales archaeon]